MALPKPEEEERGSIRPFRVSWYLSTGSIQSLLQRLQHNNTEVQQTIRCKTRGYNLCMEAHECKVTRYSLYTVSEEGE